jgi:hypothetical protein
VSSIFRVKSSVSYFAILPALIIAPMVAFAGGSDVLRPAPVAGLVVDRAGDDVHLDWDAVTLDISGQPETISHYYVYRGTTPDFVPDRENATNRIGSPATEEFEDLGIAGDGQDYYYLISAVDTAGHESNTAASLVAPPVLGSNWTNGSITLSWEGASPVNPIDYYRVYWGSSPGVYEFNDIADLFPAYNLVVDSWMFWYAAVTVVDVNGNESAFSNEVRDAVGARVRIQAHEQEELCWGAADCTPTDPEKVQRRNGWQIMVPVDFPEGDWTKVTVLFTMESRLCKNGQMGTVNKCGTGNPCVSPPCNGGYNPCGDPWDRTAHLFLVLDDCIESGGSCITQNNLELIRAVTPFGTDAEEPLGSGRVPPRFLSLDVTPFAPLLAGERYVGAEIGHFVQKGHWVTSEFIFSYNPADTSPKPPADGIQIVGYGGAPLPARSVEIPLAATEVKARVFTTGHGGSLFCDGGANNGQPCTSSANCPGGVCNPCDEFCHRENQLRADGIPIWSVTPWRSDCNVLPGCRDWNACGYPSCTFPRAGWCPGYVACHKNPPCDQDIDLTLDLPPGGTYDMDYVVPIMNGSFSVAVVVYWYE